MSIDLSILKVGDRLRHHEPPSLAYEVLWTNHSRVHGSQALIKADTGDYTAVLLDASLAHQYHLVPPPPHLDPEQVWAEMRAADGETYIVRNRERNQSTWLGRDTGARFRITAYEVVE